MEYHNFRTAIEHAALVATLAIYAFCVFKLKNLLQFVKLHEIGVSGKRDGLSLGAYRPIAFMLVALPSLLLVIALKDSYVPAVLGMAIIAIIVAADHDAALEQTSFSVAKEINERIEQEFSVATTKFQKATTQEAERLAGFSDSYRWWLVAQDVQVDNSVPRIIAVVHHWEMPTELLTARKETDPPNRRFQEAFEVLSSEIRTLDDAKRGQIDQIAASNALPRFVCNGPIRLQGWLPIDGHEMRAFYGLVHALHMLYRVSNINWEMLQKPAVGSVDVRPAKIRVGTAPIWAHVIGDDVYHIVDSDTSAARARQLYNEVADERRDALLPDRHASASAYTGSAPTGV